MKMTGNSRMQNLFLATTLSIGVCFASSASARSYILDLNSNKLIGFGSSYHLVDINNTGQAVGYFTSAAGADHAFITGPNGVGITDLGTLGGVSSYAAGINDAGQVVGRSSTATGGAEHAFITGPNGVGMTDLGTLGESNSYATGINNAGQVVGYSYNPEYEGYYGQAFIAGPNGTGITPISTLGGMPGTNHPTGINDAGHVVGYTEFFESRYWKQLAFVTDPYGPTLPSGAPSGTGLIGQSGEGDSVATDINNNEQIIVNWGDYINHEGSEYSGHHAFITTLGTGLIDLGTLGGDPSYASSINDAGQVVGFSTTTAGDQHAFITGPNGVGMTDLNSLVSLPPGGVISDAVSINNAGQIIIVTNIPEPETYALMLAGLSLISFVAWRQKSGSRV